MVLRHPSSVPLDPGADSRGAGGGVSGRQCPQFFPRTSLMLKVHSSFVLGSVCVYICVFSYYSLHYMGFLFFSSQLFSFVVSLLYLN